MISTDKEIRMAMQLQSTGQLKEAEILLNRVLEKNQTHADALHLLGVIHYQGGKIALAIQLVEQAIKSNPYTALFHSNLGEMYRELKNIHLSIEHGERAVSLDSNSATAFSNLGIAYYDAQQYENAKNCHKRALAINPGLASSLNNMGSIYSIGNKTQKAIAFYKAAIAASPHFIEPLNNLGALLLQQQLFQQALQYLQRAINLSPNFADAHCNIGLTLLALEQYDDASIHFEKASQLKPDYAQVYYGISKIRLHQHHFIEAEHYIRKAIAMNAKEMAFYETLAEIYREQGQYAEALMHLDQALLIDSTQANSYLQKGGIFMEMGEISKAEENFLKVTNDSSVDNRILAYYSLVQLRKVKPTHSSLKDLLSIITHPSQASLGKLEYAYFALGKCYDDMEEWTKAFEYFSKGAHLKRTRITYHIQEQIEFTNKLIQCFTPQTIEYLQTFANPSTVPIFIVGMPRSGSTLIEQIISSHPQVHGAGELKYFNHLIQHPIKTPQKVIHFPENISQLSPELCQAIALQYLSYIRNFSPNALHITDKMPYNFIAIGIIYALFPNAKIIHVIRDPIDTCLSCYTKLFTQGHLYSYNLTELGQYYRCYELIMAHWRNLLPANAWLDIHYESVVHHIDKEAEQLIEFCDLPWNEDCLNFYQSKRQVRTASFLQVRQPVYTSSLHRWRKYEKELAPLIRALNQPLDLHSAIPNQLPSNKYDQNVEQL